MLCLQQQLRNTNVKVIELSPPIVQSAYSFPYHQIPPQTNAHSTAELHDKTQGEKAGRAMGMPLDKFTDEAYQGLASGSDSVFVGAIGPVPAFYEAVEKRKEVFMWLTKMMRGEK